MTGPVVRVNGYSMTSGALSTPPSSRMASVFPTATKLEQILVPAKSPTWWTVAAAAALAIHPAHSSRVVMIFTAPH